MGDGSVQSLESLESLRTGSVPTEEKTKVPVGQTEKETGEEKDDRGGS